MKFDLNKVEVLARDVHKLIVLLQFYCKHYEVEELIDEIMPLIKVLSKMSDDLYCNVLSVRNPEIFDD